MPKSLTQPRNCGAKKSARPQKKKLRHLTARLPQKHQISRRARALLQWIPRPKNYNDYSLTTRAAYCMCAMNSRDGSAALIATAAKALIADFIWSAGTAPPMSVIG